MSHFNDSLSHSSLDLSQWMTDAFFEDLSADVAQEDSPAPSPDIFPSPASSTSSFDGDTLHMEIPCGSTERYWGYTQETLGRTLSSFVSRADAPQPFVTDPVSFATGWSCDGSPLEFLSDAPPAPGSSSFFDLDVDIMSVFMQNYVEPNALGLQLDETHPQMFLHESPPSYVSADSSVPARGFTTTEQGRQAPQCAPDAAAEPRTDMHFLHSPPFAPASSAHSTCKRARKARTSTRSSPTSSLASPLRASSSCASPSSPSLTPPGNALPRRNAVLAPEEAAALCGEVPPYPKDGRCGICGARAPRSVPDWKRHFLTHDPAKPWWICAGLPADAAAAEGVLGPVRHLNGHTLVGGCNRVFSRRDAYQRHMSNLKHAGDAWGQWMPGNFGSVRPSER